MSKNELLDSSNYQVSTEDGHYYLYDGRDSLKKFAKRHGVKYSLLAETLLTIGYLVINNEQIVKI